MMLGVFDRTARDSVVPARLGLTDGATPVSGVGNAWADGPVRLAASLVDKTPDTDCAAVAVTGRVDDRERLVTGLGMQPNVTDLSDGELIALAYRKWGSECGEFLVGQFALAAWSPRTRTLTCIRDHLGLQPFYYHCGQDYFVFAERIGAVLSHPATPWDLDEVGIGDYLALQEHSQRTFYQGVKRLPPGHVLEVRADSLRLERYWFPERIEELRWDDEEHYSRELRERVNSAVGAQMRGSRISVSLSGGLDSSSISIMAARTARAEGGTVTAISAGLPEEHSGSEQDERYWIELVLEQEGLDVSFVSLPEATPFDGLEEKFEQSGQPFRDVFHYLTDGLTERSSELGMCVMLNGLGGDMAASYNGRGLLLHLLSRGRLAELFALVRRRAAIEGVSASAIVRAEILAPLLPASAREFLQLLRGRKRSGRYDRSAMSRGFARRYARTPRDDGPQEILRSSRNVVHRRLLSNVIDLSGALEQLTVAARCRGVELRFPLVDRRVIEYCLAMPPEQFLQGGWRRSLFRRAMAGVLPEAIRTRTDKGAFSPDFLRRLRAGLPEQKEFLINLPLEHSVWRFVDRSKLLGEVERLMSTDGSDGDIVRPARIVVHGTMLARFLVWHGKRRRQ